MSIPGHWIGPVLSISQWYIAHVKSFKAFLSLIPKPPPVFHHLQYPSLHQLPITCSAQGSTSFLSLAWQYCSAFCHLQHSTASDGKLGGGLGKRLDIPINLFRKCKTNFQATESPLPYMGNMRCQFVTNLVTRMDEPEWVATWQYICISPCLFWVHLLLLLTITVVNADDLLCHPSSRQMVHA